MTIAYAALEKACEINGLNCTQYFFDCGETIRVHDGHILIVHETRECGDASSAVEAVAEWLLSRGLVKPEDFVNAAQ